MWMDGKTEHDGVAVVVCRHEKPASNDISGYGAGYAYLVGKLLSDYVGISYPEHIFYSPVARARHTADMHELAMKINEIVPPTKSYDPSFHENASKDKVLQGFDDALTYAEAKGMRTIEIVGHEPTLNRINEKLTGDGGNIQYGGILVIKANSWDDVRQGKCLVEEFSSSRDFATQALGEKQVTILDNLMYYGNQTGSRIDLDPELSKLQAAQREKAVTWFNRIMNGQTPTSRYSPLEYCEVFDVYKAWVGMNMAALGISPNGQGFLYSELYQKLRRDNPVFAEFEARIDAGDRNPENETYGVFNAVGKLLSKGKETVSDENLEKMKDFPLYRDIVMAGEGRALSGDKEIKAEKSNSYRVTATEQKEHDKIAEIVRNFKGLHR